MVEPAIRVQDLGKEYLIGGAESYQQDFREMLTNALTAPLVKLRRLGGTDHEQNRLWALKDVSFEVQHGEVIGIIGRNGAGKSTLLKILSRITEPTEGRVTTRGRLASLLEVGTGFHPELSGRENIFLNGAILGMTRREIQQKFDEIVAFAEVERFLDTPVKRYSSGMYVRLAFAVAAHLEPEILLVDEVLAVGDASFQQKCLGKMGDVASEGRTVLFVSHNMGAIRALCKRAILLDNGTLISQGEVGAVVNQYLKSGENLEGPMVQRPVNTSRDAQITRVSVVDTKGGLAAHHPYDKPFVIQIQVHVHNRVPSAYLALHIHDNELRTLLFSRHFIPSEATEDGLETGVHDFAVQCPAPLLVPGGYHISVHLANASPSRVFDRVDHECHFELVDSGSETAKRGFPWRGSLAVPLQWVAK